ncbi:unnamed protein product [Paramecium pentaurelia]|uniref:Anoctamin transmembrane domain-containing protein n=1 Tax=Paramecium pentaurelia TaxID=43138 RepID=A0A8S1VH29_9CILI|nr:unnamed protein product [Paramecium pentaurelia]
MDTISEDTPSQSYIKDASMQEKTDNPLNQEKQEACYLKRKVKAIQNICEKYQIFLQFLLGIDLNKHQIDILQQMWGNFSMETQETQLPDAIIKFPNPDYGKSNSHSISGIEGFELIKTLIKFNKGSIEEKILLKACEGVLQILDDSKEGSKNGRRKLFRQKVRRENQFIQFENTEESKRLETSATINEEDQKEKLKDQLILKLSNRLTGSWQFDSDQNQINEAFEIDYKLLKFLSNKKVNQGGYLIKYDNEWHRTKRDTKDFSTLIRNLICLILCRQGYYTQQFLSKNGKYIFCSLFATEESLKIQAESQGLFKLLNIQFIDLFSFEPLDKSYRPLRLNNRLWKPQNYKNLSQMFMYFRPILVELIKEIDFKRIAREVNQSGINQKLFNYGLDMYDDQDCPSDQEWAAYYFFLTHLHQQINATRQNFLINNDIAALINKQITPLELYLRRAQSENQINIDMHLYKTYYQDLEEIKNQKINKLKKQVNDVIEEYKNIFNLTTNPYTKLIKVLKKEQLAKKYLEIFKESLKVANNEKKYLKCLWDLVYLDHPLNMKTKYSNPQADRSLHHKHCQLMCWKKYQLNQGEKVTIFQSSERLRLAYLNIFQSFNISLLNQKGLIKQLFCLHDNFELYGIYYSSYENLSRNREQFYQEKLFDIATQLKFHLLNPMKMKFDLLCQYFGESVGTYFYFLCFFSQMLLYQNCLGLLYYLIQIPSNLQQYLSILEIIYLVCQLQITSLYTSKWEQQLKIFNQSYGVNSQEDIDTTSNKQIGEPKRSLINDQMNVPSINELDQIFRECISMLIFILIQLLYSIIFIALYFLCAWFQSLFNKTPTINNFEIIIIAILHLILNKLYTYHAQKAIQQLVDFEQQRTIQAVKQSYNLKLYSFSIIQQLGPLLILRFFNQSFQLVCESDSCEQYIGYYFLTYIIIKSVEKLCVFLFNFYSLRRQPLFIYKFQQHDINEYIEVQSKKPSNIKDQYFNCIEENLQQNMVELTILTYFAYIYPITYFMQWLLFVVQIYADKAQYLYYYQRPWPQIDCFVKVWNNILQYIILSSVIISSYGLSNSLVFENKSQIFVFVSFMLLSYTLNFVYQVWYSETPSYLQKLNLRQKYLVKSTLEKFKKKNKTINFVDNQNLKRMPIYKFYGLKLQEQVEQFETMSSDSDLEKYYIRNEEMEEPILQDEDIIIQKPKLKSRIRKSPIFVRSSSFYEKFMIQKKKKSKNEDNIQKVFHKVNLLLNYHKSWTDLRIIQRNYYIPRKKQFIKNFDILRYNIIQKSLQTQKSQAKQFIQKFYRKKIAKLKDSKEEHDIKELEGIYEKMRKYYNKHKWLNAQKFIFIKIKKAVWFNRFRKTSIRLNSKILIHVFQKRLSAKQYPGEETNFQHFEKNNKGFEFKEVSLQNIINFSQQYTQNNVKLIPLSAGNTNLKYYSASYKKSSYFKDVIEKVRDTYIFDTQKLILQSIMMEYFEEEMFTIPEINFVRQLNDTMWLANINEKKQPQLIQFLQLKHGQKLKYLQSINEDRGISYIQGECYTRLSNHIDKIDDFYVKGYCVIVYEQSPITTLENVIKYRKKYHLNYSYDEILSFFYDSLLLLLREQHGDISTKNYLLDNKSYYLGNAIKPDTDNDLFCLAKVLISMITLTSFKNSLNSLADMEKHDLYDIIIKMLNGSSNISELLSFLKYQEKFQESFVVERQENNENQQCDFSEYLQLTLHRGNFSLRMKQYEKGLIYIHQFEQILHRQIYKCGNNASEAFQGYVINNFMKYSICHNDMEEIIQITMVFYIKFCIQMQIKTRRYNHSIYNINNIQENTKHSNQLNQQFDIIYNCLGDLIKNLDLVLIQLQININLEQITKQEAQALFGITKNQSGNVIKLKHFERIQLINQLRLNKKLIENLFQFRKTIRRFQNQFNALNSLSHYFKMEMPIAAKKIDDCIEIQMELIKSKNQLELTKELKDLSPDLYNYNQMSPKENKIDAFTFQINFSMSQFCQDDPTYFHQLLYYYFLQIVIWHDSENDIYERKAKSFLLMGIENSPTYEYFCSYLKSITFDEIPIQYIQKEQECEIGKFECVKLQKWIEQTYSYQSEYILSTNFQYMWKQVLTYSNLNQNIHNKQILHEELKINPKDLKVQLYLIRIIQQILHLDCYFPLNYRISQLKYQVDQIDRDIYSNSYIAQLQRLHHSITIPFDSWFHSNGLLQFRLYHIQSIFFAFSPKHIENLENTENSLRELARNAVSVLNLQKDNRDILMKIQQILLEDTLLLIDVNLKKQQLFQILYSYLLLKIHQNQDLVQTIKIIQKEQAINIQPSIIILMILQILLQQQQYDQMEFLIQFCKKSISTKSILFAQMHENFENDLNIMALYIPNKKIDLNFIAPYDSLYQRSHSVIFYDDINIYSRHLIHHFFYFQNFFEVIEYFEDNLNQIENNRELTHLKQLYENFLIYIRVSIGIIKQEKAQDFILSIHSQIQDDNNTLIAAINKHILIRIYLNQKEYHVALQYSYQVLQFFYAYENSKQITLGGDFQNKHYKSLSKFQGILSNFLPKDLVRKTQINQQSNDVYYCHLIDDEFICEIILNHIDILTNIHQFKFSFFQVLNLLDKIKNYYQIAYLYKLLSLIFLENMNLEKQSLVQYDQQIMNEAKEIIRERKLLINCYQSFKHQHTQQEVIVYNQQLAKLTFKQIVYQKFAKKPAKEDLLFLIQLSAEKALEFFQILSQQQKITNHIFYINIYLILAECHLNQLNFTQALANVDLAEEHTIEIYGKACHPQIGYLLLSRVLFRKKQQELQIQIVKELKQNNFFDISQIKTITLLLIQENKTITYWIDIYKRSRDVQTFFKNVKDVMKLNQNFCDNFLFSDESCSVEDIFREITRLFPSLNYISAQSYLSASHHFIYLDENNQYRQQINQLLNNHI